MLPLVWVVPPTLTDAPALTLKLAIKAEVSVAGGTSTETTLPLMVPSASAFNAPLTAPSKEKSVSTLAVDAQLVPSPLKPALQAQVNEPAVFVQVASASQLSVLVIHSLMSWQVLG